MKYLLLISALFSLNVMADTNPNADEIALADEAIQAPTMDLEGQYQVKPVVKAEPVAVQEVKIEAPKKIAKKISQSERLKMLRERLEERNRFMVEKKMEQIRFQQELALARQLEQSMNQTLKAIDNVK